MSTQFRNSTTFRSKLGHQTPTDQLDLWASRPPTAHFMLGSLLGPPLAGGTPDPWVNVPGALPPARQPPFPGSLVWPWVTLLLLLGPPWSPFGHVQQASRASWRSGRPSGCTTDGRTCQGTFTRRGTPGGPCDRQASFNCAHFGPPQSRTARSELVLCDVDRLTDAARGDHVREREFSARKEKER